jgi:opine dehydrogenase
MNAGPIIHPPLVVANAALPEHSSADIHAEGLPRARGERLATASASPREALGHGAPHYPLADHYANSRWMYGDAHRQLVGSGGLARAH